MRVFLLVSFTLLSQVCFPQNQHKWLPQVSVGYTYTGFSITPTLGIEKNKQLFAAGLKLPVSRTYLPIRNIWGMELLYRYVQLPDNRFSFLFELSYQVLSSKSYAPFASSGKRNFIHELFPAYGFRWNIFKNVFIGNTIGLGAYYESYYNNSIGERRSFAGLNALFRFYSGINL